MATLNGIGQAANILGLGDLTYRYGPRIVQSIPPFRQYVFSDTESTALINEIEKKLKDAKEILNEEHGVNPVLLAEFKERLGEYTLDLKDEASLLAASGDSRILRFRKAHNMKVDLGLQVERLELLRGQADRFYVEALSASQAARAKNKAQYRPFEDELPPKDSSNILRTASAWFWGAFTPSTAVSVDIEAQANRAVEGVVPVDSLPPPQLEVQVSKPNANCSTDPNGLARGFTIGIVIGTADGQFIARDPRLRSIEEADALISPQALVTIASVAMDLAQQGSLVEGIHRLVHNSLEGNYKLPENSASSENDPQLMID